MLAPIVLFVYNRPEYAQKTLQALSKNFLASKSQLFIFCDGPNEKCDNDVLNKIHKTREIVKQEKWCNNTIIIESDSNKGLADSIISGITDVINKYGKIIVLEDDIVTSPYFLTFMNSALDVYHDEEKIMSISGYSFPIKKHHLPEIFFLPIPSCWGWATWDRSWKYFSKNPQELINTFSDEDIRRFNVDNTFNYWSQILDNASKKIDTWAIFFYAAVFRHQGLTLFPGKSLVENIGFDGSGVHCGVTNIFKAGLSYDNINALTTNIGVNKIVLNHLKKYFIQISKNRNKIVRAISLVKNCLQGRCCEH